MPRLSNPEQYKRARIEQVFQTAKEITDREIAGSTIFRPELEQGLPRFKKDELVLGRVLGRGGFCEVRAITSIKLKSSTSSGSFHVKKSKKPSGEESTDESNCPRQYMARRVWSKSGHYVVKQLNPNLFDTDRVTYLKGLVDLRLELCFLSVLDHINIISVQAVAHSDPFQDTGFFLVLDQLECTLSKRLNSWTQAKRGATGITGFFTRGKRRVQSLMVDRLLVAHDIAEGMSYLHSRRIIFRDLKPDNIGFDAEGTVKIFDFGLAKELLESEKVGDETYNMTGLTGAIRYMAPEIGLSSTYGLKADIYSWSMVMWYIMALEPPMALFTTNMFFDRVFKKGYRPAIQEKWPVKLCELMRASWSDSDMERPNFTTIMKVLRKTAQREDPHIGDFFSSDGLSSRSGASLSTRSRMSTGTSDTQKGS